MISAARPAGRAAAPLPRRAATSASPDFIASRALGIGQQAAGLARDGLSGHLALHQLRHQAPAGNQVDHRIKRHVHQKLPRGPTQVPSPGKTSPSGCPAARLPPLRSHWRQGRDRHGPSRSNSLLRSPGWEKGRFAPEKSGLRSWPKPAEQNSPPAPGRAGPRRPAARAGGAQPPPGGFRAALLLMDGRRPACVSEKTRPATGWGGPVRPGGGRCRWRALLRA